MNVIRFSIWPTKGKERSASKRSTSWRNWTILTSSSTLTPSSTITSLSLSLNGPKGETLRNWSRRKKVRNCSSINQPFGNTWSKSPVRWNICMRKESCIVTSNRPTSSLEEIAPSKSGISVWGEASAHRHCRPIQKWVRRCICLPSWFKIQDTLRMRTFGLWAAFVMSWRSWSLLSETKMRRCLWWTCLITSLSATISPCRLVFQMS